VAKNTTKSTHKGEQLISLVKYSYRFLIEYRVEKKISEFDVNE